MTIQRFSKIILRNNLLKQRKNFLFLELGILKPDFGKMKTKKRKTNSDFPPIKVLCYAVFLLSLRFRLRGICSFARTLMDCLFVLQSVSFYHQLAYKSCLGGL